MARKKKVTKNSEEFKEIELTERMGKIQTLYIAGKSRRQIAKQLGVSYTTVTEDLKKLISWFHQHYADVHANWAVTQMARYDQLLSALWLRALRGEEYAIDKVLAIMDKQNVMMGGEPVLRVDVTSGGEKIGEQAPATPLVDVEYLDILAVVQQAKENRDNGRALVAQNTTK